MRDDSLNGALAGLGVGGARFRFVGALDGSSKQRLQRFDVVRKGRNGRCHG